MVCLQTQRKFGKGIFCTISMFVLVHIKHNGTNRLILFTGAIFWWRWSILKNQMPRSCKEEPIHPRFNRQWKQGLKLFLTDNHVRRQTSLMKFQRQSLFQNFDDMTTKWYGFPNFVALPHSYHWYMPAYIVNDPIFFEKLTQWTLTISWKPGHQTDDHSGLETVM